MKYFISGHRDLTVKEFEEHYKPLIDKVIDDDPFAEFVVGDWNGCDLLAIEYLLNDHYFEGWIYIYCVDQPRVNPWGKPWYEYSEVSVRTKATYDECDESMTYDSDFDIAWIRPGRELSHTGNNIKRRYRFKY